MENPVPDMACSHPAGRDREEMSSYLHWVVSMNGDEPRRGNNAGPYGLQRIAAQRCSVTQGLFPELAKLVLHYLFRKRVRQREERRRSCAA